jgi:hypothetical protein
MAGKERSKQKYSGDTHIGQIAAYADENVDFMLFDVVAVAEYTRSTESKKRTAIVPVSRARTMPPRQGTAGEGQLQKHCKSGITLPMDFFLTGDRSSSRGRPSAFRRFRSFRRMLEVGGLGSWNSLENFELKRQPGVRTSGSTSPGCDQVTCRSPLAPSAQVPLCSKMTVRRDLVAVRKVG